MEQITLNLGAGFKFLPKQEAFMRSKARFRCFVGGVGSGKTWSGCWEAIKLSFKYRYNFGVIGAQTYPQLRDTTMRTFFEICDNYPGMIKSHNKAEDRVTFVNGSEIIFRALDDASKFKSLNLGWFYIDEASEVNEDVFLMLQSRLRLSHLKGIPNSYRGFVTTNPEGHNWVWRKFVGKNNHPESYEAFISKSAENVNLPDGYIESLRQSYSADWIKKYLEASFDVFEGLIYKDFDYEVHTIPYKTPPDTWPRFVGLDFGTQNPTAVIYIAEDDDQNLYIYDEIYQPFDHVEPLVRQMHAKELGDEKIIMYRVGDTSAGAKEMTSGESIRDQLWEFGEYEFENPIKDILAGIAKMTHYFKKKKIFIMRNCVNTIEELRSYQWERPKFGREVNFREKPLSWKNHALDAIRYVIMSRPDLVDFEEFNGGEKKVLTADDLVWKQVKKQVKKAWKSNDRYEEVY